MVKLYHFGNSSQAYHVLSKLFLLIESDILGYYKWEKDLFYLELRFDFTSHQSLKWFLITVWTNGPSVVTFISNCLFSILILYKNGQKTNDWSSMILVKLGRKFYRILLFRATFLLNIVIMFFSSLLWWILWFSLCFY